MTHDHRTRELSEREKHVLALVADGLTSKEIAKRLGISRRTVDGHLAHIYSKLGVKNRTAASMAYVHLGKP